MIQLMDTVDTGLLSISILLGHAFTVTITTRNWIVDKRFNDNDIDNFV